MTKNQKRKMGWTKHKKDEAGIVLKFPTVLCNSACAKYGQITWRWGALENYTTYVLLHSAYIAVFFRKMHGFYDYVVCVTYW